MILPYLLFPVCVSVAAESAGAVDERESQAPQRTQALAAGRASGMEFGLGFRNGTETIDNSGTFEGPHVVARLPLGEGAFSLEGSAFVRVKSGEPSGMVHTLVIIAHQGDADTRRLVFLSRQEPSVEAGSRAPAAQ